MTSSAAAKAYLSQSDYYATCPGDWMGKGAKLLGLVGPCDATHFSSLADNLDPRTGLPLTTYTRAGRRVGMDLTFNSTKSVGIARELAGADNAGDPRIEAAHREAVEYAMGFVEADMHVRVRIGGADHDRRTGNMVAYRVTHRDTRVNADDHRPDMSMHDHVFVLNASHDPVEDKWKAVQMGQIKHDAPYYEAIYHNRLASNLHELGYGVRRKDKAFEIAGVSDDLVKKFSRRREYIKAVAAKLGITRADSMDKLGATTRLGKAKELADDLNGYYVSRLTDKDRQQLSRLEGRPSYECDVDVAVGYSISHLYERKSVVEERKVYETALRHGIGAVTLEGVQAEALRQGLLIRDGEATTRNVLAEEARVIAFAREGRGTCKPMGPDVRDSAKVLQALSDDQKAVVRHIWKSSDRVIMIEGDAGTGKTDTMKVTIPGVDRPGVFLAPSASASRGTLRDKGFSNADTVARFLVDEECRETARNGFIYIDEAPLAAMRDIDQVFRYADELNARVILQGDRKQHKSPQRGDLFDILDTYAGLPIGRLTTNWRQQRSEYKSAVDAIAKGDITGGYDKLDALGWVKDGGLVEDYLAALDAGKSALVIAPTHAEGDVITSVLRSELKQRGIVDTNEQTFTRLRPLHWTEAERADPGRYDGTELLCYHHNAGSFKAGDKIRVADWPVGGQIGKPGCYSVYSPEPIALAKGDTIRITSNGRTKDGLHKINNGTVYTVGGFTPDGDINLSNGWVIDKSFGHFSHGLVSTSFSSQGRTVDRVLIAMGHESLPAMSAEQFYVSVSRGREQATIYSALPPDQLREAIRRRDVRKSATELMGQPQRKNRIRTLIDRVRKTYEMLREKAADVIKARQPEREKEYVSR